MTAPRVRIGDMLVSSGMLSQEKLGEALVAQKAEGKRLGALLVERGYVAESQLVQVLSSQLSIPWVSLLHVDFSRQLLNYVTLEIAEKYCLVPVYVRHVRNQGDTLYVAMDDPTNEEALAAASAVAALPTKGMVAAPSDIRNAIHVYYGGAKPVPPPRAVVAPVVAPPPPPPPPPRESSPSPAPAPAAAAAPAAAPAPAAASASGPRPARKPRMIKITLLDGTTVELPAPGQRGHAAAAETEAAAGSTAEHDLTASDLVAALRAKATGADVRDVLGNATWESMFAALLSVLLKKRLVADWEFVEEWKKHKR